MKVALIIVNYNNKILTRECILSFINVFKEISVYVVDNSTDISERFENIDINLSSTQFIEVLIPEKNIGYFPAISYCFDIIKNLDFEYFLVGNNDVICDSDWPKELFSKKDIINNYPVICPRIINLDGFDQNPMIPKSYSIMHVIKLIIYNSNYFFSKLLLSLLMQFKLYNKSYDVQKDNNKEGEIAIGFGAFYIITADFINSGIEFPINTFLMGEEQFLYIKLKKVNKSFYYLPSLVLRHKEHSSVNLISKKHLWSLNKKAFWKYIWKMPIRLFNI